MARAMITQGLWRVMGFLVFVGGNTGREYGNYYNGESNGEACGKNEKLGLYKGYIGVTRGNRMSQHLGFRGWSLGFKS